MSNDKRLTGFQQPTPELDITMEPIYDILVESGLNTLNWRDFRIGFLAGLAAADNIILKVDEPNKEAGT